MNAYPTPGAIGADKMVNTIQCGHPEENEDVLWFLQAMSWQPGGLAALVDRIAEAVPGRIGTPTMRQIGNPPGGKYTAKQASEIWDELPESVQQIPSFKEFWTRKPDPDEGSIFLPTEKALMPESFRRVCIEGLRAQVVAYSGQEKADWQGDDGPGGYPYHGDVDAITRVRSRFHWAVNSWQGAVRAYAQIHAKREMARCVQTEVARRIWSELDDAIETKQPVLIEGDSRTGKTFAASAWCRAHPGRARLVTLEDDRSQSVFHVRMAKALGIDYQGPSSRRFLKEQIAWVVGYSGLLLVIDEAHYAIPDNPSPNEAPKRLNWIRANLMDQGHGCVLISTPQSFKWRNDKFVNRTGYNQDQFWGRLGDPVLLPKVLPHAELLAVVRHHFPSISEARVQLVAGRAERHQGYLAHIADLAEKAKLEAKRRGGEVVTNEICDAVLERYKPAVAEATPVVDPLEIRANQGRRKTLTPGMQAHRNQPASVEKEPSGSRAVTPAGMPLRASEGALVSA